MTGLSMKYFVLKPAGDDAYAKASRCAMRKYAWFLKSQDADDDTHEHTEFANGILAWVDREYTAYIERTGGEPEVEQ